MSSQHLKNACSVGVLLLLAFGITLRIEKYAGRNLWADEILQIKDIRRPFADILKQAPPHNPEGFVGDFLLVWPFHRLSGDKWLLALPHIFSTLLGFFLFVRLCFAEVRGWIGRVLATLLFVCNRNLIFHALEIRPYAVLPTMALGIFLLSGYVFQKKDMKSHALLAVFLAACSLFHAYGLLMGGCCLAYQIFKTGWPKLPPISVLTKTCALYGGVALAVLPVWLFYASFTVKNHQRNPFEYVGAWPKLVPYIFGNLGDVGVRWFWILPSAAVFVTMFLSASDRFQRNVFLFTLSLLPIGLIFLSDLLGRYHFLPRQLIWVMPFWAVSFGKSVDQLVINFVENGRQGIRCRKL